MIGYTFETKNLKTGETYYDKCYSVTFLKNFFGESDEVLKAIDKYGKNAFEVKMIMPYETVQALDEVVIEKATKKTVKVKETPNIAEDDKMVAVKEVVVEEEKPKKGRKKKVEE